MEEKEKLAELGASLIIFGIILSGMYLATSGWLWLVIKFVLTVLLIYGIRDWCTGYDLLVGQQEVNKSDD